MKKKYSIRQIAALLHRSPNSVSREIRCNQTQGIYDPKKAQHKAYVRRKYAKFQGMKIVGHDTLRKEVVGRLRDDQSPEAIAGYLKHHHALHRVSKDSVYRFIKSVYGRRIEAYRLRKHKRRGRRRGAVTNLPNRTFIGERPKKINARSRIGDVEADFIVSGKSGKGILLVVVDRKSRVAFLERIRHVSIAEVHSAFQHIKVRFPEMKTITMDNDILFAKHEILAQELCIKIYFCHPYHSWEKGTAENTNKVIRRDIPKGNDISRYSKHFIERLEQKLNRRPMKCLKYQTPQEVLDQHRKRMKSQRHLG